MCVIDETLERINVHDLKRICVMRGRRRSGSGRHAPYEAFLGSRHRLRRGANRRFIGYGIELLQQRPHLRIQ